MFKSLLLLALLSALLYKPAHATEEPVFMNDAELAEVEGAFISNYEHGRALLNRELNDLNTWMGSHLSALNTGNSAELAAMNKRVLAQHADRSVYLRGYEIFYVELHNIYKAKYTQIGQALRAGRFNVATANSLVNGLNQRYGHVNNQFKAKFPRN